MLMAGLDGIERGLEPPSPWTRTSTPCPPARPAASATSPRPWTRPWTLERDHAFLLKGGVFTEDLLEEWIRLKREEAAQVRLRPSPMEYYLYYDL